MPLENFYQQIESHFVLRPMKDIMAIYMERRKVRIKQRQLQVQSQQVQSQ